MIHNAPGDENRAYIDINKLAEVCRRNPKDVVEKGEKTCADALDRAVRLIAGRMKESRIVLLAGPSSSGKTTFAYLMRRELERIGIGSVGVSMDDYFFTVDRSDANIDYETPDRMDMNLCEEHIETLNAGGEISVPRFDFQASKSIPDARRVKLRRDEVAVFEGIHALNEKFMSVSEPTGLYVSARMRLIDGNRVIFKPEWLRFLRRCVRDAQFRNTNFISTFNRWPSVLAGERKYILPNKNRALIQISTACPVEPALYAGLAFKQLSGMKNMLDDVGMGELTGALEKFNPVDASLIPERSLLREFIGDRGIMFTKRT